MGIAVGETETQIPSVAALGEGSAPESTDMEVEHTGLVDLAGKGKGKGKVPAHRRKAERASVPGPRTRAKAAEAVETSGAESLDLVLTGTDPLYL
ncbi:hypothetical protein BDV93DRAFT_559943 [Ceratobasidium sp. AG-I]|nr:hypothetical protein BDV93DRAFT_559943 [Ceratobasidium sp. AG-I]